jgi:SAM-dependent methyltransferase
VIEHLEIGDAFGEALLNCLSGDMHAATIVERDDGFIDSEDIVRYFAPHDEWPDLDRWCCQPVSGRVLDIGAGAGRHSLFLQERGCAVTALDVSPLAAEVCRRRGVRDVFVGTIEDLAAVKPEPFDVFCLLGNNLGLLRDQEYAVRLLSLLASMGTSNALLVGTNLDPYRSGDHEHLAYHDRNRSAGRMPGQVRIRIRHRSKSTPWMEYLFLSPDELQSLSVKTSWRIVDQTRSGLLYGVRMTRVLPPSPLG